MHSYKLLNFTDYINTFPEDMNPDIQSFAESDNIYMRIQCERQSFKPFRYLTIPIGCIYMSQFILLPSLYYRTLNHSLLLFSDDKYFPILFALLYMPLVGLPVIYCNLTYKILDFFLIMAMLTKLLLFTKRFVKFIFIFVIILSYIVFICYEIYMFLQFCSIFHLHISVLLENFTGSGIFTGFFYQLLQMVFVRILLR